MNHPQPRKEYPKVQSKAANERPIEGVITGCKPNKNAQWIHQPIVNVENRKTLTRKFDNRGSVGGGNWCPQRTQAVGDSATKSQPTGGNLEEYDDSAGGRGERQAATKFRAKVRNLVAKIFHYNKNVDSIPVLDSPESAKEQRSPGRGDDDADLCVNWKQELVRSGFISWRGGIPNAQPDEGPMLPRDVYLNAPADTGKLPRDTTKEDWIIGRTSQRQRLKRSRGCMISGASSVEFATSQRTPSTQDGSSFGK